MERTVTPATPYSYKHDYEEEDSDFLCVGKSMTFQSKSYLNTPSIRSWQRSPILNSKRKSVSPRPTEPLTEGEDINATHDTRSKKQVTTANTIFPAIVAKENTEGISTVSTKNARKETTRKQREKGEMKHSLPKVKLGQQSNLTWLQSELHNLMGKMMFKVEKRL